MSSLRTATVHAIKKSDKSSIKSVAVNSLVHFMSKEKMTNKTMLLTLKANMNN